jgi:hypothetical protein
MGNFFYSPAGARMLLEMLLYVTGKDGTAAGITEDGMAECAWYPESRILLVMNNTPDPLETEVRFPLGVLTVSLNPFEMKFVPV